MFLVTGWIARIGSGSIRLSAMAGVSMTRSTQAAPVHGHAPSTTATVPSGRIRMLSGRRSVCSDTFPVAEVVQLPSKAASLSRLRRDQSSRSAGGPYSA